MILQLDGVSHAFGDRAILSDFSLGLAAGQHSLLLGPSGSGKTTLVNLVCGLLTPDRGTVFVGEEPMSALSPSRRDDLRRRRIGVVFQTLRLVSALDLRANLALAQRLSGGGEPGVIDRLLDRLGIVHRAAAKPRDLSQGEAQRAAIARALVGKPDLLVADEPTSALDDANADTVGRLLIETADANGTTLLIATHDRRLSRLVPHSVALGAP
jgi:putative ABC transport system ATP-binding protein